MRTFFVPSSFISQKKQADIKKRIRQFPNMNTPHVRDEILSRYLTSRENPIKTIENRNCDVIDLSDDVDDGFLPSIRCSSYGEVTSINLVDDEDNEVSTSINNQCDVGSSSSAGNYPVDDIGSSSSSRQGKIEELVDNDDDEKNEAVPGMMQTKEWNANQLKFILPVHLYQDELEEIIQDRSPQSVTKFKEVLQDLAALPSYENHYLDVNKCLNIDHGVTPLILAAKSRNLPMVKYFVEELKADVNATSRTYEESAVGWTALNLDVATADYLIAKGADVNLMNTMGQSPIYFATKNGDYDFVVKLVEHGANCLVLDKDGNTLLTLAAMSGFLKLIDFYVTHGVDINAQNQKGETVLMKIAKVQNKKNVLLHLLEKDINFEVQDHEGKTALDYAAKSNRLLLVSKMREKEAKAQRATTAANTLAGLRNKRKRSEVAVAELQSSSLQEEDPGQSSDDENEAASQDEQHEATEKTTPKKLDPFSSRQNDQHEHLLERIHLYEGKKESIDQALLTPASCEDLIIKLETTINRVQERKKCLEEEAKKARIKEMDEEDANTCVLCLDQKKEAVSVPCGHISMCLLCTTEVMTRDRKCPICRVKISKYYKIYN